MIDRRWLGAPERHTEIVASLRVTPHIILRIRDVDRPLAYVFVFKSIFYIGR
jgi:hypothetical protein